MKKYIRIITYFISIIIFILLVGCGTKESPEDYVETVFNIAVESFSEEFTEDFDCPAFSLDYVELRYDWSDSYNYKVSVPVTITDLNGSTDTILSVSVTYPKAEAEDTDIHINIETPDKDDFCFTEEDYSRFSLATFDDFYENFSTSLQKSNFIDRMKGRTVHWSGVVSSVQEHGLYGEYVIFFSDGNGRCAAYFDESQIEKMLEVNEGDYISIKGSFDGEALLGKMRVSGAMFE